MIALLDLQQAMRRGILAGDDTEIAAHVVADGIAPAARVGIYRNSVIVGLTKALTLSYPVVVRLVGEAFFETAARVFIEAQPPEEAWLDRWGGGFGDFLAGFAPAASLPYLPAITRLEWAVTTALHAADVPPLDTAALATVAPERQGDIAFVPHSSVGLVDAAHPVDAIWRAVLARDDAALAAVDLDEGPVRLLVARGAAGVVVTRCSEVAWRFAGSLFEGRPLAEAFWGLDEAEATALLAEHLASGRVTGFSLVAEEG